MTTGVTLARRAWGLPEIAESLGVSVGLLRKQIDEGKLRSIRLGKRVLVSEEELQKYINQGHEASDSLGNPA